MSAAPTRLYMSMSLDGFIAGPDDRAGQELGRDGGRLFNWLDDRMGEGVNGRVHREAMATGAAGDRAVAVMGAGAAQALLRAGLLDEMEINLVQVLLGGGRRLFDALGPEHIELELVRQLEGRDAIHLRYRVHHR
jgi:dihydrofolate reductase